MRIGPRNAARVISAIVVLLVCGLARPAWTQVTSASVAGVVKGAQGGVIPGATVMMISEKLGTKSAPVLTSGTGDFRWTTREGPTRWKSR
jgi:hypothetical protein